MTSDELNKLIALGESTHIEFKRSLISNIGREICAFANAFGGKILLGISNSGEIIGLTDSNRVRSKIQTIARSADPPIRIEIKKIESIICVDIPFQERKPYSFQGKFYIREGANSQQMSRDEIGEFFYEVGYLHYDRSICQDFSLDDDVDKDHWLWFQNRAKIPAQMSPRTALRNLDLITRNYKVTNACAWLLAKNIRNFNTSADVSCVLFMGTSKTHILDQRDFHSDIHSMIHDTVEWILSKINIGYIIEKLHREERPEFPPSAIREAVVNAFAHRDYRSSGNIQVYLYSDRLEIISPGGLPSGMTKSDFGTSSIPRNPLLFGILHRTGVVERVGHGIHLIQDLCKQHKVATPKFSISKNFVMVTFFRSSSPEMNPALTKSNQDSSQTLPDAKSNFDNNPDNSRFIQDFLTPESEFNRDPIVPNPKLIRNYFEPFSLDKSEAATPNSDKT